MKKTFTYAITTIMLGLSPQIVAQTDANGYTTVEASMGNQYSQRVFYNLSANQLNSQDANNWDIAFRRDNVYSFGTRVNDARNVLVYQVSSNPDDFNSIDIANISNWGNPLYNPDNTENLFEGAFEQTTINNACNPNLAYGWGCYNPISHKIEGKVSFVLKYPNNTYVKFIIDEYYGVKGYTFRYAKANSDGVWGPVITKTVNNGSADTYFNYYSFTSDSEVANNEPNKKEWDFMFTRYWNFYGGVTMYRLSGVIQSPSITVARKKETQETNTINMPNDADFSKNITSIGHSWKPIGGVYNDIVYYIKKDKEYYRLYFIKNGGMSTGDMHFKYKNITSMLSTNDVNAKVSFGMYPNPAPNKQVTILYDIKTEYSNKGNIKIFDASGKQVYEAEISKSSGFFQKDLNLNHLNSGVYFVNLKIGDFSETKKLIIK